MRELREFRVHHAELCAAGADVAGVCRDSVESNRAWTRRLALPFPLLSDASGDVARALGVLRRIPIGAWTIELMRRSTLLAEPGGRIAVAWGDVKIRGHARQVLDAVRATRRPAP